MATWTAPTTRASGALITATIWNTDLVENLKYLKDAPVIDTAVILGAATTSGIRLDLESGVLAVREGDDSAYGPMRALSLQALTSGTLVGAQSQSTLQASFGAFDGAVNASVAVVGATRGVLLLGGQSASATSGLAPIKWVAGVRSTTDENTARIAEISADSLTGTNATGGALYFSTRPTSGNLTERMRITGDGHVQPGTNDGGQLGVSGTAWSDLFLASGGVINFNAGDVTITHVSNRLNFNGATGGYYFTDGLVGVEATSSIPSVDLKSSQAAGFAPCLLSFQRWGASNTATPNASLIGQILFSGLDTNNAYAQFANISVDIGTNAAGGAPGTMTFATSASGASATERMRITSGGYFKASNNGTYDSSTGAYHELYTTSTNTTITRFTNTAAAPYGNFIQFTGASPDNNTNYFFACADSTTTRLIIYSDGDVLNHDGVYGTISDAALKQDIIDAPSQWEDVKAFRFRKYRMKTDVAADANAPYLLGVVAQELAQVSPGLVDEHPDMDKDNQPLGTTTKTVKSSILLMKAAVALQEAMGRIETLESRVAALEA